jgi:NTE family protein
MAGRTIDVESVLSGILTPGTIADKVVGAYKKHLFGEATLQDLPDDPPRFVINATNVQSGALWRFMKPAMRDYRVGAISAPTIPLAVAVAASSAFPPVLSPLQLELREEDYDEPTGKEDLHYEPYTTDVFLTDGGVYDNLGLETAWKRYRSIFVSDAGGKMSPEAEPKTDWARHSKRVLDLIDNQVRNLRKRQVIDAFDRGERTGAYWGIRTDAAKFGDALALDCPIARTRELADLKTRLERLDADVQERLINWGYAVCDAAVRCHYDPQAPRPAGFPFPRGV